MHQHFLLQQTKELIFCLLLMLPLWSIGQEYTYDVQHISLKEGLPNRQTTYLEQDAFGNMWGNCPGMIFKYDGYTFETFRVEDLELSNEDPPRFTIDDEGLIWYHKSIRTAHDTIFIYNPTTKRILSLDDFSKERELPSIEEKEFFISQQNKTGVFFQTLNGKFYSYEKGKLNLDFTHPINRDFGMLQKQSDGEYWFRVIDTLFHRFPNGDLDFIVAPKYIHYLKIYHDSVFISYKPDPLIGQFIWSKIDGEEIVRVKMHTDTWSKTGIQGLIVDDFGTRWMFESTKDFSYYIMVISPEGKVILDDFFIDKDNLVTLRYLYFDNQQNLWITSSNGLYKITRRTIPFKKYVEGTNNRSIIKIDDTLLIAGKVEILHLDVSSKKILQKDLIGQGANFYRKGDDLWIGGYIKNLKYKNLKSNRTKNIYPTYSSSKLLYTPYHPEGGKNLWIGTNAGLVYLDKMDSIRIFKSADEELNRAIIRQAYQSKEGTWLVTNNGLFLTDKKGNILEKFSQKNGALSKNFNHLYEDKAGVFWLGSKDRGLIRWDRETNSQQVFGREQGLFNENIYAIYEDDYGFLWMPSDYGLIRFNKETFDINTYLPEHGLLHEEFNTFSHYRDSLGNFYFGGLNGVISFHPKDFIKNTATNIPLHLKAFKVLTKSGKEMLDLTKEITEKQQLIIRPSYKLFEVYFTLMDFKNSGERLYAYKIEGYDNNWNYTTSNFIRINTLPYGKYELTVKGQVDGIAWSTHQLKFDLVVLRPFYLRWWFLILAIGSIISGIVLFFKYRTLKLKEDKEKLEIIVTNRTAKIKEQSEELKQLDVAKTRFFSNITHEFRTPLTLILGPAQQLYKKEEQAQKQKKLGGIVRNANHLLELINQLLDLSKLEGKRMGIELKHGNITTYTEEIVNRLIPLAQRKEQELRFFSNQKGWKTDFDPKKWNKIVFNLLSNAIKFTPEKGKIQLCLTKQKTNNKDFIHLAIQDNGLGISDANLNKIFNRFYQEDGSTTRIQEGAGIGLSLVKELVELQNGKVMVNSEVGKGTTFEITIPIVASQQTVPLLQPQLAENTTPIDIVSKPSITEKIAEKNRQTTEKLSILIIEDNAEMRTYIRSCLTDQYHITEANNGVEGIEQALETIPDLIISDVMMPKKDGFEVVTTLRNDIRTSHIPIVLLTAKAALKSRLEGLQRGADAYLTKPFSPKELDLRVRKLIEVRRLLQQRYQNDETSTKTPSANYQKEDAFILELKTFIRENLNDKELTVENLGKHFQMSRVHFYRKIKALTNDSASTLIRKIRLERAMELIKERKMSVSEITYETGFSSPSYFSRAFKKEFGKSPSEVIK